MGAILSKGSRPAARSTGRSARAGGSGPLSPEERLTEAQLRLDRWLGVASHQRRRATRSALEAVAAGEPASEEGSDPDDDAA